MKQTSTTGRARIAREWEVLEKRVQWYCHCQHQQPELCDECRQLLDYSRAHLRSCRFGAEKPICESCSFGCWKVSCREKVKAAISTARSRLVWRYPRLTFLHWLDGFHHPPARMLRVDYTSWGGE